MPEGVCNWLSLIDIIGPGWTVPDQTPVSFVSDIRGSENFSDTGCPQIIKGKVTDYSHVIDNIGTICLI